MALVNFTAIYVLWKREMKRFFRAKSRVIGMIIMPLLFLGFLGLGFRRMELPGIPEDVDYLQYLIPGMIGMAMLFSSTFAGISVLWDREFGFLKEIMIAPVTRVSIVLGRIAGGTTTAMFQGIAILIISSFLGFRPENIALIPLALLFMLLISATFIGLGLIIASFMKDMQGFGLIMNFIILPIFFLSGAIFPIQNLPSFVRYASYADPLTYGVDGLRGSLIGVSSLGLALDLTVALAIALIMVFLGAFAFEKSRNL